MKTSRENDLLVVSLPSSVTRREANAFFELVAQEQAQGNRRVAIDASGMNFIDSSGVGVLVFALKTLRDAGGDLVVRNLQGDPLELFRDTGLHSLFTMEIDGETRTHTEDLFREAIDLKLEISHETRDAAAVLHLSGMINTGDAARKFKEQCLLALVESNKLLLEMENLTFLDSNAVGEVMGINRLLQKSGGDLRFVAANELIKDLLMTLNLDKVVKCFETAEEALMGW